MTWATASICYVSGRGGRRAFAEAHAHDQELAEEHAWRGGLKRQPGNIAAEITLEVNRAALAKRWNGLAGRGVDGVKKMIVSVEDAPLRAAAPVDQTAVHAGFRDAFDRGRVEAPQLAAGRRLEREELQIRRGPVEHAVDPQWVALDLRAIVGIHAAGVVNPGDLQLRDVAWSELLQGRVMAAGLVANIGAPVRVGGGSEPRQDDQGRQEGLHR